MGNFQTVERRKSKLRLALTGVSGSGKTLGALLLAKGLTGGDWSRVALIDTEHERARMYANRPEFGTGAFLYAPLKPPYSPDKYKELVQEAASLVGPDGVVIVDSFSHAWSNEGGVLEIKDKIASQKGMNSYTAWNQAGKEQNKLVNAILAVDCHTIVTMRSKMEYALQENERGKMQPVKLGMAPIQRDDTEYEFDIVLDIARSHVATASKDVTFLDKYGDVITPELGRQLKIWLDEGTEPMPEAEPEPEAGPRTIELHPINPQQWKDIKDAAGNNADIIKAMQKHFGAEKPSDLAVEWMDDIIRYVTGCVNQEGVPYEDSAV